jgi:predicted unusual protein kinase regulating ubiquinone biosynthesis (AarF/ABC1/UbiB family)
MSADERLPGRLARTLKTTWLTGRLGASYAGGRVADLLRSASAREEARDARHAESAARIAMTLRELRGPMMKVGQLLSTHAQALPPEYAALLAPLQQSVPALPFATIRRVIEAELGAPPELLFADFSERAVAAASLGQVHRARLRPQDGGGEVAVKVQYPGAAASVEADAQNVSIAAGVVKTLLADLAGQQGFDVTPMAEELVAHLRQETDYAREAWNAKLLGRLFADDPRVLVPRVHDTLSSARVVTYDWVEGVPLDEALDAGDAETRRAVSEGLVHLFWRQFFAQGVLHADPHPGNFRVLPDGRLGLLDHGCVKIFDESFMAGFAALHRAREDGDRDGVRAALVRLALVDDAADDAQVDDLERLSAYFAIGLDSDDFDFGEHGYVDGARALARHFVARRRLPPQHRDFLFLTRVVLGHYEYYARARARLPFRALVRGYTARGWRGRAVPFVPYD